jgi:tetratricopeptide (TPR) repeat protein
VGSVSTSTREAGLHPENATSSPNVASKTETSNSTDSAQATSLQTALELLKAQEFDKAIAVLQKARRSDREDPVYRFTLAQAYFGKKRYWASLEQYRIAVRIDPALRDKAVLNENLIVMLGEDDLSSEVRNFVIQNIGQAALPHLQRAAEKAPNAETRKRAAALAGEVSSLNPQ